MGKAGATAIERRLKELPELVPTFDVYLTTGPGDAVHIAANAHDYDTVLAVGSHLWMLLNLLLLWEYTGGRTALDGRGLARYALLQVGIAAVCTLPFCLLGQSGTCLPALLQPAGALLQLLIAFGLMLLCRRTGKRS